MGSGKVIWAGVPLRLATAIVLGVSGHGKFGNMPNTIASFAKWGFPIPEVTAWFIALLEFVGAIALVLGLFVRYLGALYTIEFIVAAFWVKLPLQGYREARLDLMILAAAAALFFVGAGPLSIDSLWSRKREET